MKKDKYLKALQVRGIRLSDEIWEELSSFKPRNKSWDLFMRELLEGIKYFKNL